jgi:hypothetical protein
MTKKIRTEITIQGTDFYINGEITYRDRYHCGRKIEGLLFNSRMVQAIFDDENPRTQIHWIYPDTCSWDPDRNTNEFCEAMPLYRKNGLLGVTVGLQGGGPIYTPNIYENYLNSAFHTDGGLKPRFFDRVKRILNQANKIGMVVILNYFYWQQYKRFKDNNAIRKAVKLTTEWVLENGFRNVLVDINNEVQAGKGLLESEGIHELIEIIRSTTRDGNRLLVGTSIHPWNHQPPGRWSDMVDFFLPHGNDSPREKLRLEIKNLKTSKAFLDTPRPILINEDSIDVKSLDIAVDEGASWGFYSQGFGSNYRDYRWDWTLHNREDYYESLSGFQTPPINWGINTDFKKMFFNRVKTITGD